MLHRLLKVINSMGTRKPIKDSMVSTTVDDMSTGEKMEFDPQRVQELLVKCDLLDKPHEPETSTFNHRD